jgi:hypothetical protein
LYTAFNPGEISFVGRLSASESRNALRPANEKVDKSPNPVSENDNKDPNDFVVALIGLFRRTVHDHPNPEDRAGYGEEQNQ